MGQILSYPLTSKLLQRHGNETMRVGVSEMQGYRVNMEDQHTVRLSLSKKHPNLAFFSVFDGHAGDRASVYLAQTLAERVGALENPTNAQQLTECLLALDADFLTRVEERGHGSTAVFAVVEPLSGANSGAAASDAKAEGKKQWRITVGNIGDSRVVLIRKNGECIGMTEDHKPNAPAEAERIRAAGGYVSSNRVDGQLAMSRAIGDWNYKGDTGLHATKQKVIAVPDITTQTAEEGDILLVCCDGIVEQMKNEDAAAFVSQDVAVNGKDPATMCARLLEHALKSGSKDNMTAMIVQFGVDGKGYEAKDEYVPGPYYAENREFVDAFKTDARRHGLAGAELESFIGRAMALPKEPTRGGGGGGGMGGLASLLRSAGGAGPSGDDDDDDDRPSVYTPGGAGGAGAGGVLDLNGLSQRDQLRALMELLQKSGGGPVAMDEGDEDEDDDDRPAPPARGKAGAGAGAKNGAAGGAGASGDGAKGAAGAGAGAGPGKSAKKNAKKRAKKKSKAAAAAAAAGSPKEAAAKK